MWYIARAPWLLDYGRDGASLLSQSPRECIERAAVARPPLRPDVWRQVGVVGYTGAR